MPVVRFRLYISVLLCRLSYIAFAMFDVLRVIRWLPDLGALNIVSDPDRLGSEKRGLIDLITP